MTDMVVRSRVDPKIKAKAAKLFEQMGLTLSDAIRIFLYQSVAEKRIPFLIAIPNAETLTALNDVNQKENLKTTSLKKLKNNWEKHAGNNSNKTI